MDNNILFLSDVHLGAHSEVANYKLENQLVGIVDFAENNNFRIVILGDLYDYWMEYPNHQPDVGQRLMQRFNKFHQNDNPPTLYITGNHDCWTCDYHKNLGFDIEHEYRILQAENHTFMVHHGDGLSKPELNLARSTTNNLLRNQTFISGYQKILPAKLGIKGMKYFSKLSRPFDVGSDQKIEVLNAWSKEILTATDIDFILCGHDHRPRTITVNDKKFINTGAFYEDFKVAVYNSYELELVTWSERVKKQLAKREYQYK